MNLLFVVIREMAVKSKKFLNKIVDEASVSALRQSGLKLTDKNIFTAYINIYVYTPFIPDLHKSRPDMTEHGLISGQESHAKG